MGPGEYHRLNGFKIEYSHCLETLCSKPNFSIYKYRHPFLTPIQPLKGEGTLSYFIPPSTLLAIFFAFFSVFSSLLANLASFFATFRSLFLRREIRPLTLQISSRIENVEDHERKEHGHGVEDVAVPFVCDGGGVDAHAKFDEAVDVAEDDEGEDCVDDAEEGGG